MSNDPNKRTVRIVDAKTGEVRMSEPVQVQAPRPAPEAVPTVETTPTPESTSGTSAVSKSHAGPSPLASGSSPGRALASGGAGEEAESHRGRAALEPHATAGEAQNVVGGGKAKGDIETLEHFIEYAYGRKGQRVSLKSKVERRIAQDPRLDAAAMSRLLALAASDTMLAVPRQLLLFTREIDGFPALRAAIGSFVSNVMLRHPVFADPGVRGALLNAPEALSPADALAKVAGFVPPPDAGQEPLKGAELQVLRRNASNLYVTWLANNRSANSEELAALLFQVVWHPAARELPDDNARLRALTELEQPAGVGLACYRFRQQTLEARSAQEQAMREASDLRARLAETDAQRVEFERQRDALHKELEALRTSSAAAITELRSQHEVERTHLRHAHEQLRGRLVCRLEEGTEMLEVGLTALRNKTPRVEVMLERAEHVVDALRAEMNSLREE
jgi:hypothetical protein